MSGSRRGPRRQIDQALRLLLSPPFDEEGWRAVMGPDCHLRIGNRPPAVGRERALCELRTLLPGLLAVGVGYWDSWTRRGAVMIETEVIPLHGRGSVEPVPCVVLARIVRGRIRDLRFYLDPEPLRAGPMARPLN